MKSSRILTLCLLILWAAVAEGNAVKSMADGRLDVVVGSRKGQLALYTEADLDTAHPEITRAIIIFHGLHRNSAGYLHDVQEARDKAGVAGENTLLIAPQFLNEEDARANKLAKSVLHWQGSKWEGGDNAVGPAAISSYSAIDAILARLSNKALLPNLKEIVLAGHSGGGQVVQRYAVTGRQIASVAGVGIKVRYVVANPSSYLYFDTRRLLSETTHPCPGFNTWKYGFANTPSYVGSADPVALAKAYISRDVTYLLGALDDDANGPDIDKDCAAEAQGLTRLRRGIDYFKYLQLSYGPGLQHRLMLVPGVSHNAREMFNSLCGIDALFQTGACKEAAH